MTKDEAIDAVFPYGIPTQITRSDAARFVDCAVKAGLMTIETEMERQQSTINEIFSIRVANNLPWKRLMEIAMKHAPEETKAVLREINENDRKVSDLLAELAK